jgi:hypothetical protein
MGAWKWDPAEIDEHGQWTGTCEKCGTSHDGYEPGTVGGDLRCVRAQAVSLGAGHLVDQVDAVQRDMHGRRDEQLRAMGLIP